MTDPTPPRRRQPIFNVPGVLVAILAILVAVQAVRDLLPFEADLTVFSQLAFVPARLTNAIDPTLVSDALGKIGGSSAEAQDQLEAARYFLDSAGAAPWTMLTYALLHANWTHLGLNAVWLLAFGAPVARRFGALRFLLFFAAGALAGAFVHVLLFPTGFDPLVGASAAVSAAMGAALRFVFRPVRTADDAKRLEERTDWHPPIPIPQLLRDRRATAFLSVWFLTNIVTGLGPVATALAGGPIAWQAHIGGFLLGFLGFVLFDPPAPDLPPPPLFAEPEPPAMPL